MRKLIICAVTLCLVTLNLSAQSTFNFAFPVGGTGNEINGESVTDFDGNLYLFGGFYSTSIDADPGAGSVMMSNTLGGEDGLLIKYDTAGNYLWSLHLTGQLTQRVTDVAVDPSGIFVCGFFHDTVDFDPGAGVTNLIGSGTAFQSFVAKYNHSGGLVWAKVISNWSQANAIAFTPAGNLCVVGIFGGSIDSDPGPGVALLTTNGSHDCYYVELTPSNGNFIRSTSWGSAAQDRPNDVVKLNGYIVIAGAFSDSCDFDPGPGTHIVPAAGTHDGFLLSLDTNLQFSWVHTNGVAANEYTCLIEQSASLQCVVAAGNTIAMFDLSGIALWTDTLAPNCLVQRLHFTTSSDIVAAGLSFSSNDFDPGPGFSVAPSGWNVFRAVYNSVGTFQNVRYINGATSVAGLGNTPYGTFNMTGLFLDSADFDPSSGVHMMYTASLNLEDMYVTQYTDCTAPAIADINLCTGDTFLVNGLHLTAVEFIPGTPQILCIELNQAYTANETFSWIEYGTTGCDTNRIVTIHATPIYTISQTLNICSGDSVVVGTNVYTNTGVYTDILASISGCDSTVTTNLTVNSVDTAVSVYWSTLTSSATGASYQWIDCGTGLPIAGATSAAFTATTNGLFACIVTQNACTDTSSCYSITDVGLTEQIQHENISCYPNPTKGSVTIVAQSGITSIRILDLSGRLLFSNTATGNTAVIDLELLTTGTYIIEVTTGGTQIRQRVLKE